MDEQQKIELLSVIFRDATRDKMSQTRAKQLERNLQRLATLVLNRPFTQEEIKTLCESMGFVW